MNFFSKKYCRASIHGKEIKLEIADSIFKKTMGLMFRKHMPENNGMLFVSNKNSHHTIWMLNMNFPIDIIWLNKSLEVVDIFENAQPNKLNFRIYRPKMKSRYVLEVNAGFVKKHGLKIKSKLKIK